MNILIVDDEDDILDINSFYVEEYFNVEHKITTAKGGTEAILLLQKNQFDLCICDHNMPQGLGTEVCNYIYKNKLKTKFVLCSSVLPNELPDDYAANKIYSNIVKPDIGGGIEKLVQKLKSDGHFQSDDNLTEERYVPIAVKLLFILVKVPCDIFISLTDSKYVKCLNKDEFFTLDDKNKYLNKGVNFLYLKMDKEHTTQLNLLTDSITKLIKSSEVAPIDKMLNVHFQVSSILRTFGVTDEMCEIAKESIKHTVDEVLKHEASYRAFRRLSLMGEYPSMLFVMQSTLCGVLSSRISWCTEATLQKLVAAGFYQDITLDSIKLMKIEDFEEFLRREAEFSNKEKEVYTMHPIRSKDFITKIKSMPADVDRIVLEQHEMPTGNGFPRKLNNKSISAISAMFILTNIISKRILSYPNIEMSTFIEELKDRSYHKGNFKEIFTAFEHVVKN